MNLQDFSKKDVFIDISWSSKDIKISIKDDGPGFPEGLISKIGEPFMKSKINGSLIDSSRPEYESMGLGLFIAKTLLERSGAALVFKNYCIKDDDNLSSGAEVTSVWKRKGFEETWSK